MKYLTIQDANRTVRYFDKLRTEQGCAQLLSLDEFNDPYNWESVEPKREEYVKYKLRVLTSSTQKRDAVSKILCH
ncbi:hypothetical protein JRO89_XS01G0019000 [Xanthoceras sorbifolium]|uniref:Uncharacterized protein n=1 Tax=Xanthoceras sorbifolium TaxID=99658 RepID=A0ABQ8IIK9_9ROSI|nr:hypothetical protein JRO89_XS01G0019000 [Xanthoceras sorbifolium]